MTNSRLSFSWESDDNPNDLSGVARFEFGGEVVSVIMRSLKEAEKLNKLIEAACDATKQKNRVPAEPPAAEPLWVTAMMAFDSTPGRCRDGFAASLRVITDWLVPEEKMPLPPKAQIFEYHLWRQRQQLRQMLLKEVDRAEQD